MKQSSPWNCQFVQWEIGNLDSFRIAIKRFIPANTIKASPIIYLLPFISEVRARRVVHQKESEFLLNGINGENFIKIPSANLNETGWCTNCVCFQYYHHRLLSKWGHRSFFIFQ